MGYSEQILIQRREYTRLWRQRNRDHVRAYKLSRREIENVQERSRYAQNPEKFRKLSAEWYEKNRELVAVRKKRKWKQDPTFRASLRAYRRANSERYRLYYRNFYSRNRESRLALNRKWRKEHPDADTRYKAKARAKNPEPFREKGRRYDLRKRNAPGSHTFEQWMARVEFYVWRCVYCKKELTVQTLTQDHVKPVSKGGSNWASNLVPACKSCNSSKNGKWNGVKERKAA
jgi:5-methylcytosine-specific restriction endonuclease McrA